MTVNKTLFIEEQPDIGFFVCTCISSRCNLALALK